MAIDIIARGLATSLVGADGKIAAEKMPTLSGTSELTGFTSIGKLTDPSLVEGKTAEEILLMMLYGIVNPTLTEPTLNIALSTDMEQPIIGRQSLLKGALTFSRGAIDPAFGTSGYRAGAPIKYTLGEHTFDTSSLVYDFEIPFLPTEQETAVSYSVLYSEGEQPVNSVGQPIGAPLAAGTISHLLTIQAAYPLYSGEGTDQPFTWFEDEEDNTSGYLSSFGSEMGGVRQSFAVSKNVQVVGVKAFNTLTQQWEWIGSQTAAVSLTYFNIEELGDSIKYTYNSTPVGARELKICVE